MINKVINVILIVVFYWNASTVIGTVNLNLAIKHDDLCLKLISEEVLKGIYCLKNISLFQNCWHMYGFKNAYKNETEMYWHEMKLNLIVS